MQNASRIQCEHKIDQLLGVRAVMRACVERAQALLNDEDFPQSRLAAAEFAKAFDRELEASLLRAYDDESTSEPARTAKAPPSRAAAGR